MNKQAPSAGRILTMLAFAGSCVGLLIFLWISFGGATPFAAQGYLLKADFREGVELATQADVRISGIGVGKVIGVTLNRRTGLTQATMRIDSQYAPRPADTRAILRAKTLLGETYVELTPGSRYGPKLPDGATLPQGHIAPTVQLDQILSTFDAKTRHAFQVWVQQDGAALTNRAEALNAAFGELYPFAHNVDAVLSVLRRDSASTTTLLRDTGQVFASLSQSPAELQGFIRNSNATFAATAAEAADLAATVRAFPAFLVQTRATVNRTAQFARLAKPLIDELRPAATQLSPALQKIVPLAPELLTLMQRLGPVTQAARTGVPALENFLRGSVPWLARLRPYLGGLVPIIDYINDYRREVAAFFANSTATTQASGPNAAGNKQLHYLRISNPINPELLTEYSGRLQSNRGNPYMAPGGYAKLLAGLDVFGGYLCTKRPQPTIGSSIPANLAHILKIDYYTSKPGGPTCKSQPPLGTLTTGQSQYFPHLQPLP
jgi:phospholipid/cholesterol/gamma-HCH transport system substrate-binding protein